MLTEAANALWAYSLRGGITADQIDASLVQLRTVVLLVPDDSILTTAVRLAVENRHPVYDCLYLGLALEQRQPLATADRKLAALAEKLSIETELIEPAP